MRLFVSLFCLVLWMCVLLPPAATYADELRLTQLNDRCAPGQQQCNRTCCAASDRCSWDGHCIPLGANYCGGGRSCPTGQLCTDGGLRCAPHGSTKCALGNVCPPGTVCGANGECDSPHGLTLPKEAEGTGGCLPGGGCTREGWFRCEETESQCRPGFKCSQHQGCVPIKAVDCGYGKWCKPGEICLAEGGCAPDPDPDQQSSE